MVQERRKQPREEVQPEQLVGLSARGCFGFGMESWLRATGLRKPKSSKVPGRVRGRVSQIRGLLGDCWEQCCEAAFFGKAEKRPSAFFGDRPKTVSESTVSKAELSEFVCPHGVPGTGLSDFL